MRNSKLIRRILLLSLLTLTNCSKEEQEINRRELFGLWISTDKKDTLDFKTNNDFYKSNGFMKNEHFDYKLFNDSIQIEYNGILYINVNPTKHRYSIINNKLTLDFTNKPCYGFGDQIIIYEKE